MEHHTKKHILKEVKYLVNDETDVSGKLLEQQTHVIKRQIDEALKPGKKFLLAVEILVVISIIGLVAVGAIHYQYNLLSPSIEVENGG